MNKEWRNRLYFGDNLEALRNKIPDSSVNLIYFNPSVRIAGRPDAQRHRRCNVGQSVRVAGRPKGAAPKVKKTRQGVLTPCLNLVFSYVLRRLTNQIYSALSD
ncbi:hypothetical protein JXM67_08460 [candidate division WOR-3 bacterium]|nr:hypothetical protein [candidate division WOR-3 bacterium]